MFFTGLAMLSLKFKKTIRKYNLITKGDSILSGVSGGADSLALLYLLNDLKKERGFGLAVAHLDHALRSESAADAEFVRAAALRLGLPFFTKRIDLKSLSRNGSTEELARKARLDFLFKVAAKNGANKIALGHNFDDQAETVLMRILRGTGLLGLSGILPKRNMAGLVIIRPLIDAHRCEIEAYLKRRSLRWLRDSTNSSDIYLRNKVRNRLLPLLEKEYNKNIREVLANMSETGASDYDYLSRVSLAKLKNKRTDVRLNLLREAHQAIRRLMLRHLVANASGSGQSVSFKHIRELEDLIANRPLNSIVDLPCKVSAVKKKFSLFFVKK